MDLWERLSDSIDSIQGLPMPCSMGFLDGEDTLCVYSMPGSRTVEEYFGIEISETPFVSEQDVQGNSTYLLGIKITIHQFKN